MRPCHYIRIATFAVLLCAPALMSAQTTKRVLYLTHSAGFRHDSIEVSKRVLTDLAAKYGKLEIVSTEDLTLISELSLRQFDAVLFFTSGELPLSADQKAALLSFVRAGKGFAGVHSATDTLYTWAEYGDLIGGYFDGHPWVHEVGIDVEEPEHPLVKHLAPSFRITEEIYQFRSFSRDRLRVLMTLDTATVDLRAAGVNRTDEDFALAWTRLYGAGRVFYTALGHFDVTWLDPRFQTMLSNALLWVTGELQAEGSPRRSVAAVTRISTVPTGVDEVLAPGGLFAVEGVGLTTGSTAAAAAVPLPSKLAGTSVRINGVSAPLFEASPSRVVAQSPYNLTSPSDVVVMTGGIERSPARQVIAAAAVPRLIAASGGRTAGYAVLYATGLGAVTGDPKAGAAAPASPLARTPEDPIVRIGGVASRVRFAGLAPGLVGVYQVNVEWPTETLQIPAEITLEIGGRVSNTVSVP